MYAIVKTGGKQYKVSAGDTLTVEKIDGNVGDTVFLEDVLMISSGEKADIGTPQLANAKVAAEIISQTKNKKIIIFKSKRRKGYQKLNGHRQSLTQIVINGIGAAKAAKKAEKKVEAPVAAPVAAASTDLESMTVAELRDMARDKEISGFSSMKKAELIEALSK